MRNFVYAAFFSIVACFSAQAQGSEWSHDPVYNYADIFEMEFEEYSNRIAERNGCFWIAGSDGLLRYDRGSGKVYLCNTEVGIPEDATIISVASQNGALWFSTYEYGAYLYKESDGAMRLYRLGNSLTTLYLDFCYAIAFDGEEVYMGSNQRYAKPYPVYGGEYYQWDIKSFCMMSAPVGWYITDMAFDSSGTLWMTCNGQHADVPGAMGYPSYLMKLTPEENMEFVLCMEKDGEKVSATSLAVDDNDNIWYVRDNGIHCYNQSSATDSWYWSGNRDDIPDSFYTACEADASGNIWFTSADVLLKYDGTGFTAYTSPRYDNARSIYCEGDVVWVYSTDDVLYRFENGEFSDVIALEPDLSGVVQTAAGADRQVGVTVSGGVLTVLSADAGITGVEVCSMDGRIIVSRAYAAGTADARIDLGGYAGNGGGLAVVRVSGDGWQCVKKVVLR